MLGFFEVCRGLVDNGTPKRSVDSFITFYSYIKRQSKHSLFFLDAIQNIVNGLNRVVSCDLSRNAKAVPCEDSSEALPDQILMDHLPALRE